MLAGQARAAGGWHPVLEGALARQAEQAVVEIVGGLATATATTRRTGHHASPYSPGQRRRHAAQPSTACLAAGTAGVALLYGYLTLAPADARPAVLDGQHLHDRMRACLASSARTASVWPMRPGLYVGFTGIAWAVAHLTQQLGLPDTNLTGGIDTALLDGLGRSTPEDADLIRGLVGVGVYGLERLPSTAGRALAAQVVMELAQRAHQTTGGLAWRTPPHLLAPEARRAWPKGRLDLGMAHGVAGVVAFLARAHASGIAPAPTRELLEGGVRWLLAQRLGRGAASAFPAFAGESNRPAAGCRPGWCYGDPGVAAALLAAGQALGDPELVEQAVQVAIDCTGKAQADAYPSRGAGLCHGTAGIAHTVNAMYQATGDGRLRAACRWWFAELLCPGQHEDTTGRSQHRPDPAAHGPARWGDGDGFLTGATGIALALLAASASAQPGWDAVLLVSLGRRRGG